MKLKFGKLLKHIPWKKVIATSWQDISVKLTITIYKPNLSPFETQVLEHISLFGFDHH